MRLLLRRQPNGVAAGRPWTQRLRCSHRRLNQLADIRNTAEQAAGNIIASAERLLESPAGSAKEHSEKPH
jgi:hypothetical protein